LHCRFVTISITEFDVVKGFWVAFEGSHWTIAAPYFGSGDILANLLKRVSIPGPAVPVFVGYALFPPHWIISRDVRHGVICPALSIELGMDDST
jgi:hypothetical protein